MKECIKTIKQTMEVTKDDIWFCILPVVLGNIVGIVITVAIMLWQGDLEKYAHMGTFLSFLFGMMMCAVGAFACVPSEIEMAISMGKTRKYLGIAYYVTWIKNVLILMLIVLVSVKLESLLYSILYPGLGCEIDMEAFLYNPVIFALIVVCVPAVVVFMGTITLRIGKKILYLIYGCGISLIIVAEFIAKNQTSSVAVLIKNAGTFFAEGVPVSVLCLLVSAVCFVASQLLLRKQGVVS